MKLTAGKVLGLIGLILNVAAVAVDAVAQEKEIQEAADEAAERALNKLLTGK